MKRRLCKALQCLTFRSSVGQSMPLKQIGALIECNGPWLRFLAILIAFDTNGVLLPCSALFMVISANFCSN